MSRTTQRRGELLTVGYEGRTVPELVVLLQGARVEVLVDVRERPQSRRPAFNKSRLARALRSAGVRYAHVRALGSPAAIRHAAQADGNFARFMRKFKAYLNGQADQVTRVARLALKRRVCLLCFERSASMCHRTEVADRVHAECGGEVRHL